MRHKMVHLEPTLNGPDIHVAALGSDNRKRPPQLLGINIERFGQIIFAIYWFKR
jgi:hypothetical protein